MLNTAPFFDCIFNNSSHNAIMIMSVAGVIQQVNAAFTTAYGYSTEDLKSKNFRVLYIEKDQTTRRPEIELNETNRQGFGADENYLVHKDGTLVWVSGESILIKTEGSASIVKIIHNIHAQKQLERYLLASSDLLDSLFESVKSGLLLLDSQARIIKTNAAFLKMFGLDTPTTEGSRIQEIPHSFWGDDEVRNDIRKAMVHGENINKEYISGNDKSNFCRFHIISKSILGEDIPGKRLLLVVKNV